jgi:hypothetical protein
MQIELQYHKEYAAITGSIGFTPSVIVRLLDLLAVMHLLKLKL